MKIIKLTLSAFTVIFFLTGCGFQMRGDWNLPPSMQNTVISGNYTRDMYDELKRNFQSASATLSKDPSSSVSAKLRIHEDRSDRRIMSVDVTGKALEYELYYILRFDVVRPDGVQIVPMQRIVLTRNYLFEDTQVIGSSREENLLKIDLRKDVARDLMRRLQAQAG
ncbi:MAG: hypothetical protein EP297_05285 [Gammaproteobacteria bacterium]|nr:MAG: hypothetical protein EP297_05285 [Gammaproteobacteria bacterium]